MAADLTIPKGDKGYNLAFIVTEDDGTIYNLAGYTVTLKVWPQGISGSPIVSGGCTVDVAADGTCHYAIGATDFTVEGDYLCELELTKAGVIESTRYYTLKVTESP